MNSLILIALFHSLFNRDLGYYGAHVAGTTTMYNEFFAEYFWIFNLLLWGLKFYNEYRKAKSTPGDKNDSIPSRPKRKTKSRTNSKKWWSRSRKKS